MQHYDVVTNPRWWMADNIQIVITANLSEK